MSFKSNSLKSENKTNISIQLSQQMSQMRESVTKSVAKDLPLLRSNIEFSKSIKSMTDLKKIPKNQTITETEIKAKLDEINSKVESLAKEDNDITINCKDLYSESLKERTNRLKYLFPTFKRIAYSFEEKSEKRINNENNCLERKPIDINDEKVDQLVKSGQQIQHFQRSDKYLKSINK